MRQVKNGKPSAYALRGDAVRALRELRRQFPDSAFVFATKRKQRGASFTVVRRFTCEATALHAHETMVPRLTEFPSATGASSGPAVFNQKEDQ